MTWDVQGGHPATGKYSRIADLLKTLSTFNLFCDLTQIWVKKWTKKKGKKNLGHLKKKVGKLGNSGHQGSAPGESAHIQCSAQFDASKEILSSLK